MSLYNEDELQDDALEDGDDELLDEGDDEESEDEDDYGDGNNSYQST